MTSSQSKVLHQRKNKIIPQCFILKSDHQLVKFDYDDIVYLKADGNYSIIYLKNHSKHLLYHSLKDFEKELPGNIFYRCHRSYIVNIILISSFCIQDNKIFFSDHDIEILCSRRSKKELIKRFKEINSAA
jgi:two-component system, LytTR family, response regulator